MSRVDVCTERDLPERPGPRLFPEAAASPFPARTPGPSPSTRPPPPSAESPVHRSLIHLLATPKISEKSGHDPQTAHEETRPEATRPREPAAWVLPTWGQRLPSVDPPSPPSPLSHIHMLSLDIEQSRMLRLAHMSRFSSAVRISVCGRSLWCWRRGDRLRQDSFLCACCPSGLPGPRADPTGGLRELKSENRGFCVLSLA